MARSRLVIGTLVLAAACSGAGTVPKPSDVSIVAPGARVPAKLAAFSGTWEGRWDGELDSRLVVERVGTRSARVVYAWADDPNGSFKAGWSRHDARVLGGDTIQFGNLALARFTFTISGDGGTIEGQRNARGMINRVTMKKAD